MNAIVKGSLSQIAKQTGRTLAESWINVDAVILVDISLSMTEMDACGGKSRYDVAQEELTELQETLPGKIAIVAFSEKQYFVPTGTLPPPMNTTDLAAALKYVRIADSIPGMRFILISDGEPNDEDAALDAARKFKNRIDTIYVGPESGKRSREFLQKLANLRNGEMQLKPQLKELAASIHGLLEAA